MYCNILAWTVLRCAVLCCAVFCCAAFCCAAQLYSTVLYFTVLYFSVLWDMQSAPLALAAAPRVHNTMGAVFIDMVYHGLINSAIYHFDAEALRLANNPYQSSASSQSCDMELC